MSDYEFVSCKIIEDSVDEDTLTRLTTMELSYPRFIHGEFLTHRWFSRNASSSRAIPVDKIISMVEQDPVMPFEWGMNEKGMQANTIGDEFTQDKAREIWLNACHSAIKYANELNQLGIHKQLVNRILEPFSTIKVLVTATEWDNFFQLRDHEDAQPEIRQLAIAMKKSMTNSTPNYIESGISSKEINCWHLPFISKEERALYNIDVLLKCSTARCARVSYMNHDGTAPDIGKDVGLYDRLVASEPRHSSPCEHAACSLQENPRFYNNLRNWCQYRYIMDGYEQV